MVAGPRGVGLVADGEAALDVARDLDFVEDRHGEVLGVVVGEPAGLPAYGDPVPGYKPPPEGPAAKAEHRACAGLTDLVAAAWPQAGARQSDGEHDWSDFDPRLADEVRETFPDLPPAAVALSLRVWGRMHGLVSLEVYGRLGPQTREPAKLYRAEIHDLIRSLGLPRPA
jgi:hypothetical protein